MKTGQRGIEQMIPTSDAEQALLFCRAFAEFLSSKGSTGHSNFSATISENINDYIPQLSVVIPIHNEAENIETLCNQLTQVLTGLVEGYEIIFVDDGSTDSSVELLSSWITSDHTICVIQLTRRFGQQVAITAGLHFARGRAVVVMDADLQDPPEVLPAFLDKLKEGNDVVYAVREQRKEHVFKRVAYSFFYRIMRVISDIDIPLDAGDFCIMDRKVVNALLQLPERNRFLRGIRSWVGYKQTGIAVVRQARHAGTPKYTLNRLIRLALDGLVSFSFVPLRTISLMGMMISFLSLFLAVFYGFKKFFYGLNPPGFATIVVLICFFAGIQLITIGLIGEYVGRVFEEVKQRPLFVIKSVRGKRFS